MEMTTHKIINANSAKLSSVPDASVDLIVTSPPYPMIEMWDELFCNDDQSIACDLSEGRGFAAFTKMHSRCECSEQSAVNQFFHILKTVAQPKGLTQLENGEFEYTRYSSCCNTDKGIYYYCSYDNQRIISINMHLEELNGTRLILYPLLEEMTFTIQNG
jgi:hypothetical protein